jgi:hypothetical protein
VAALRTGLGVDKAHKILLDALGLRSTRTVRLTGLVRVRRQEIVSSKVFYSSAQATFKVAPGAVLPSEEPR